MTITDSEKGTTYLQLNFSRNHDNRNGKKEVQMADDPDALEQEAEEKENEAEEMREEAEDRRAKLEEAEAKEKEAEDLRNDAGEGGGGLI